MATGDFFDALGAEIHTLRARVAELAQQAEEGRHALAALRRASQWYQGVVDSRIELVLRFSHRLEVTFANEACCRLFGKARDELVGAALAPLFHHEDWHQAQRTIDALGNPPHRAVLSVRSQTPQGWRWLEWEDYALLGPDGQVEEIQAIGHDVTELRQVKDELRRAHQKLLEAREEERRRVARDLHDSVAQELVVLSLTLQRLVSEQQQASQPERLSRAVRQVDAILREIRDICYDLYPPALERMGLPAALVGLERHIREAGLDGQILCDPPLCQQRLSEHVEVALFRIAQEAVSNAVRHGQARRIDVHLSLVGPRQVALTVCDDGQGFDPVTTDGGLGLRNMHERVQAVGGRLEIHSQPGQTQIGAHVPLPGEQLL